LLGVWLLGVWRATLLVVPDLPGGDQENEREGEEQHRTRHQGIANVFAVEASLARSCRTRELMPPTGRTSPVARSGRPWHARRPMGVPRAVIEGAADPMPDLGQAIAACHTGTVPPIGDDAARLGLRAGQQALAEALRRHGVPPLLPQEVQHHAAPVQRAAWIMPLAVAVTEPRAEVPGIAGLRPAPIAS
jgi:hypothetical protein